MARVYTVPLYIIGQELLDGTILTEEASQKMVEGFGSGKAIPVHINPAEDIEDIATIRGISGFVKNLFIEDGRVLAEIELTDTPAGILADELVDSSFNSLRHVASLDRDVNVRIVSIKLYDHDDPDLKKIPPP